MPPEEQQNQGIGSIEDFDAEMSEIELDNAEDDGLDDEQPQEGDEPDDEQDEPEDGEGDEPEDDGEQRLPKGAKRRIDRLTRRLREAEARLRDQPSREDRPEPKPAPTNEKPVLENFDTYEDWVEALTDWKADQKLSAHEARREAQDAERTFTKRFSEGRKAYKDWDDVVTDDVQISMHMADAIKATEAPADVIYYLSSNPELADRILDMSPQRQALEIGKIEAKVLTKREGAPKAKRTSNAPEPIRPVKQGSKAVKKTYEEMDVDSFIASRNKEEGVSRRYQ